MDFLEIDGSQGEGGGQVLRLAASFSVIKNRPIHITRIRAGRETPGLKRQHAATLRVLADAFDADLKGATEGSAEISFSPEKPSAGRLAVDMKTAASITLVLQAVVPAASISGRGIDLELTGGTDVPWSPTFDYLDLVARRAYAAIGVEFECVVKKRGYYPKGGGVVETKVKPGGKIVPIDLSVPDTPRRAVLVSRCANLPKGVAERQSASAEMVLKEKGISVGRMVVSEEDALSPGSSVLAYSDSEESYLGGDAIGLRGKRAEEVGREAGERFSQALASKSSLDANVADMVCPFLSLASKPSRFRVPLITKHLETGLSIARLFTSCSSSWTKAGGSWVVTILPKMGNQ